MRLAASIHLLISLILGLAIARTADRVLDIRFGPKELPRLAPARSRAVPPSLPGVERVAALVAPPDALDEDLYARALAALADALERRTGVRPAILEAGGSAPPGDAIAVGAPSRNSFVDRRLEAPREPDAFALRPYRRDGGRVLAVMGSSRTADAFGVYWLADELETGLATGGEDLFALDRLVEPRVGWRLVDAGAVGIVPDSEFWGNDYSHHTRAFEEVILESEPYVDEAALAGVRAQFESYVHRMLALGYNGIVLSGFLEYVNFDRVGSGDEIYGRDHPYRKRHLKLRATLAQMFRYAHAQGLRVIFGTDMLALTPALEHYLERRFGGLDVSRPELWEVYRLGIEELFSELPWLDGLMIRIGEAGAVYNVPGWGYRSQLAVRSAASVRSMLRELLPPFEARGKTLIFRSWSVGVGDVGDMHTNPATYERVLGDLDSSSLLISTKYCMGDFDSYLPLNPTLEIGRQGRIVEFQARREFEGFNAFPNYVGPLHQAALRRFLDANPRVAGLWLWTQRGGPLRAGPMSLYPLHGFWLWIDPNVYATARLAWDPDLDPGGLAQAWARRTFHGDPALADALTDVLIDSREAVLSGLYIGEFARRQVLALGLEPPPMLWIFKWDIVTGSHSALSAVYRLSRERIDAAIEEGFSAVARVRRMRARVVEAAQESAARSGALEPILRSLDYEENLLETLAWYRAAFLSHYQWLDTGAPEARRRWEQSYARYQAQRADHVATYGSDRDFPAYSFFAADRGMTQARRGPLAAWIARVLLLSLLALLVGGCGPLQRRVPSYPGKGAARALWTAIVAPWRSAQGLGVSRSALWALVALLLSVQLLTAAAFSALDSPPLVVGVPIALLLFVVMLKLSLRVLVSSVRDEPVLVVAASGLGLSLLTCAVLATAGPLHFWYRFWVEAGFRSAYLTLLTAALAWPLFALFASTRRAAGLGFARSVGVLLFALGASLAMLSVGVGAIGLERALTALNDSLLVVPVGLSRILGITTHLNIPAALPTQVAGWAGLLGAVGLVLTRFGVGGRRTPAARHPVAPEGGAVIG